MKALGQSRAGSARRFRYLMVCLPALLLPRMLAAQIVRGAVRDSASREVVAGAVVLLLDSTHTILGRGLTNARGMFSVPAPSQTRIIRVLRIGFRPRELPLPSVSEDSRIDVTIAQIATLLTPVSVIDQPKCPSRKDRGAALALWEQARAALLATTIARDVDPPRLERLMFDRHVDEDRTLDMTVLEDTASSSQSFVASHGAREFIERGFREDSSGIAFYHGPDADVLLDDAFPLGYCFTLENADKAHQGQIGLGIHAADHQNGRIDIDGALWIDSTRRMLTELTFRYVGLERGFERSRPGGNVSFREVGNGTVLVDRWTIRLATPSLSARGDRVLFQTHENGGELARATWPDGREWHASLGTVRGIVLPPKGSSAANVTIQLINTSYRATTDSAGGFVINDLVPGPYRIGVVEPRLDSIGITLNANVQFTASRDSVSTVDLTLPTLVDYARAMCKSIGKTPGQRMLVGRALQPNGEPARNATFDIRAEGSDHAVLKRAGGTTSSDGVFVGCDFAPDTELAIKIDAEGGWQAATRLQSARRLQPFAIDLVKLRLKLK